MTRPDRSGDGGMTGATGDLTPDDAVGEFVPAERREISDPEHQAEVTTAHGRGAPAQHGELGEPGESSGAGAAPRDGGTGSEHGLSGSDPAYRMESRPDPGAADRHHRHDADEPRATIDDGDEFADHEEHF
jgi:hypothetical protein